MATQPIEDEPSPSKSGVHVVPAFSVRHTPPEATATNQRFLLVGSTARSAMRPLVTAGPMPRSVSPDQVSADQETLGLSSSFLAASFWAGAASALGAGVGGSGFA